MYIHFVPNILVSQPLQKKSEVVNSARQTVWKSSRPTDSCSVYAILVRVRWARVESRVVNASVGEDSVDGVSGETRRVSGQDGGEIQLAIPYGLGQGH